MFSVRSQPSWSVWGCKFDYIIDVSNAATAVVNMKWPTVYPYFNYVNNAIYLDDTLYLNMPAGDQTLGDITIDVSSASSLHLVASPYSSYTTNVGREFTVTLS